jgi:hypothetical protein
MDGWKEGWMDKINGEVEKWRSGEVEKWRIGEMDE